MRALALVVLGACSFNPGQLAGSGPQDSGTADTSSGGSDASPMPQDAMVDAARPPANVRSLAIVDTNVAGGPHTDFPMLVTLAGNWLKSSSKGGDVLRDDGFDLYFAADFAGASHLDFEVDSYDPTMGTLTAWVKVPSLSAQTVIYVHYGNPAITTSQQNAAAVWSNGYEIVLHMDGTGDATGKNVSSSTAVATTGEIGGARDFDGFSSSADIGTANAVDNVFAGGGTMEAWIRPQSSGEGGFGRVFDKGNVGVFVDNTNATRTLTYYHECDGGGDCPAQWHFGTNTVPTNAWHSIAVVHDTAAIANVPTAVIDGASVAAVEDYGASGAFDSDGSSIGYVGNKADGSRTFDGIIDEFRLSSAARSADWLTTTYRNESDPTAFYVVSDAL